MSNFFFGTEGQVKQQDRPLYVSNYIIYVYINDYIKYREYISN